MKKFFKWTVLAATLTLLTLSYSEARNAYVSDMLVLTFREGPGTQHSVIKTLTSNTPLSILEEEQGFYKVQLGSGEQGWVDKQFVVFDLPKAMIIEQLNQEKAALENQLEILMKTSGQFKDQLTAQKSATAETTASLEDKIREMQKENTQLAAQLKQSQKTLSDLKAASEDVVATLEANKTLTAENKALSQSLDRMEKETSHMFRTGMIKWFLAGVGVLLLGWVIGQSASSKRRRGGSLLD